MLMQIQNQAMLRCHLPREEYSRYAMAPAPSLFRILIVNEDMRSADSLKSTLHALGYTNILTAYSARRALLAAPEFAPSIAVLDLELPDMTGYQLANRLRTHLSKSVRKVPLLAIAESTRYCTSELTRAAGFMGWLPKPVDAVALNAYLGKLQTGAWS
jgi:CheY-like chemotaxis protein